MAKGIAAVTGGSGMVGRKITQKLLQEGYEARVLTRNKLFRNDSVQVYYGDIEDTDILRFFLKDVSYLFHCAAELHNEPKMWDVNVLGTEKILHLIPSSNVAYFCYLSSVGVIGLTDDLIVDERSKCNPQNTYEKSKGAAEQLATKGIDNCNIAILRPTNVIDEKRPGALALPIRGNWRDRFTVFLKGSECAHIVHVEDVADAAIFFMNTHFEKPECYIVSYDHDARNTYAGLWNLYKRYSHRNFTGNRPVFHMPMIIPHMLRSLKRGKSNRGNIQYSSDKLLSEGFRFSLGVEGTVQRIASYREKHV